MKLQSLKTLPQAPTRTGLGPAPRTDYIWTEYDLTLCFIRVPVLNGKENESSLLPVVRVKMKKKDQADVVHIPLSNVVDWVPLEQKHLDAAEDKSRNTVAGRVGQPAPPAETQK